MMMQRALVCGFFLLCGGALATEEGHKLHRRARHRHVARPPPAAPPPVEQQEEDLTRVYDQAAQQDLTQQQEPATSAANDKNADGALQDLADATTIKGQFNEFLARVTDDATKLKAEVQKKEAQVEDLQARNSNLELHEKSTEVEEQQITKKLQGQVQKREAKFEQKLKNLQTQNEQLTTTNLKLVGTNDDLSKHLEEEKARNHRLVVKLQNMASTFTAQQRAVQEMVSKSAQKVAQEAEEESQRTVAQETAALEPEEEAAPARPLRRTTIATPTAAGATPIVPAPSGAFEEADEAEEEAEDSSADGEDAGAEDAAEAPPPPPAAQVPRAPRGLSRRMAAKASSRAKPAPVSGKKVPKALAHGAATSSPAKGNLRASTEGKKAGKSGLPVLPAAPPKKDSANDEQLESLRNKIEELSASKVDPMAAIQQKDGSSSTSDDSGLLALQDVGNMLKDVDGM